MNADLVREWRRWATAERDGQDDLADLACRAVVRALPADVPRPDFADRVMQAVERRAVWQARVTRALVLVGSTVLAVLAIAAILQLPRLLLAVLDLGVAALVWVVLALERGLDVWAILAQMGRTAATVIAAPQVTFALVGIALIGAAALYALQRILESEEQRILESEER